MTSPARCPCCHQPLPIGDTELLNPVEQLERACVDRGYLVTPDQRVTEAVAAELLGRSARTLEDWAREERIPVVRVHRRRTYRLADIAAILAAG